MPKRIPREKGLLERARLLPPVIERRDFCALFGVHRWTLQRRVKMGWIDLPAPLPRVPGGVMRWLREDIVRWLDHPELRQPPIVAPPLPGPRPVAAAKRRRAS